MPREYDNCDDYEEYDNCDDYDEYNDYDDDGDDGDAGETRWLTFHRIGPFAQPDLLLVDTPGYGFAFTANRCPHVS